MPTIDELLDNHLYGGGMQMEEETEDECEVCERGVNHNDLLDIGGKMVCVDCYEKKKEEFYDKIKAIIDDCDDWEVVTLYELIEDILNER